MSLVNVYEVDLMPEIDEDEFLSISAKSQTTSTSGKRENRSPKKGLKKGKKGPKWVDFETTEEEALLTDSKDEVQTDYD